MWTIAAVSTIGTSHEKRGMPCQDAHAASVVEIDGTSFLVAVACDGAGSAKHAEIGSSIAATTFHRHARNYLFAEGAVEDIRDETLHFWLHAALAEIGAQSEEDDSQAADYATTLLAAIIGANEAVFVQIGDGAMAINDEDGWRHVFWPDNGLYANETTFLTSGDMDKISRIDRTKTSVVDIAIFTDGIENLVLRKAERTIHAPFFEAMVRPLHASETDGKDKLLSEQLGVYLRQPRICDLTDDDKTLVLASRAQKTLSAL